MCIKKKCKMFFWYLSTAIMSIYEELWIHFSSFSSPMNKIVPINIDKINHSKQVEIFWNIYHIYKMII